MHIFHNSRRPIISIILLFFSPSLADLSKCVPCDERTCLLDQNNCPGEMFIDPCGCCIECAKELGENCGEFEGRHFGQCRQGLICETDWSTSVTEQPNLCIKDLNDSGESSTADSQYSSLCVATYSGCNINGGLCVCAYNLTVAQCENPFEFKDKEDCLKVQKQVPGQSSDAPNPPADVCADVVCQEYPVVCPKDSSAVQMPLEPGECCPRPPSCQCDPSKCSVIICISGYEMSITDPGDGEPGNCCDVYECVPKNMTDCDGIICQSGPERACPEGTKTIMGRLSEDGCCLLPSSCDCDASQCAMPSCWDGYSLRRVQKAAGVPGDCCDEYLCVSSVVIEGCTHQDINFTDGERWPVDSCRTCECRQDRTHCTAQQSCYEKLCLVNQGFHEPGERWNVNDCTTCECIDGEVACTTINCRSDCVNPRRIPGICCPVCDGEVFTPQPFTTTPVICPIRECQRLSCEHGFAVDRYGCPTCQCLAVTCPSNPHCPPCAFGYRFDENGCQTCRCRNCPSMDDCNRFCPYGYQRGKSSCLRCRCERCPPLARCTKQCVFGLEINDRGCQICKCKNNTRSPAKAPSTHECTTVSGDIYSDGESWHDGCRWCYCHDGREMCALIACPVPQCDRPIIIPDFCCPVCVDSGSSLDPAEEPILQVCHSLEGHFYVEGETWSVDSCTDCVCHNGHVLCSVQECPPLLCDVPIYAEDHCCGTCPLEESKSTDLDGLTPCVVAGNQFFPSGSSWKDDDCTSCQCNNGQINCFPQSCPVLDCLKPVLRKGQCCASCIDTPEVSVCEYGDEVYMKDDIWHADACLTCTCHDGAVSCSNAQCPPLGCKYSKLLHGQCCPSCIEMTTSWPELVTVHDPESLNERSGTSLQLIACIILSCIVVLLLLLVLIKRKHRFLYNVNKRQVKQPEDTAITIMSIKPKNTDPKQSNKERDSIRDSKVFKENFANKANNVVNSKLDRHELKYIDKYAGREIDHV